MPSARRKSYQKQSSQRSLVRSTDLGDSPGYCQLRPSGSTNKSRKVEYIKLAQARIPRLTASEMALAGFNDKHILIGQVEEYNRRIQLPTFHIKGNFTSEEDVEYEGCLRFFLAHADNNFTKAIRLTSSTTWKSLKPLLLEKFNLTEGVESGKLVPILYAVKESGESSVRDEDCPLVIALMASTHVQFVLKVYQEGNDVPTLSGVDEKNKVSHTNSFFSAMKKKLNKTKSKEKLLAMSSHKEINTKLPEPIGPNPYKHGRQRSGDSSSIGSRQKSDASSRKSAASNAANFANSSAVNARSMENLSKAVRTLKKKKKGAMSSSVSNMLAIDDTEEYITIHGDRGDLGLDEISIPIDGSMTVRDLIADVLEECEISLARVDDYCLCDVIGRECEGLWLTDYARDMNDSEKPLLLISMMKPSEGLSRRFEIKNVSKDEETGSHCTSNPGEHLTYEMRAFTRHTSQSLSSISNLTDYNSQTLKFPTDCPYFLTIQSYDAQQDAVLHLISNTTSIIGSSEDEDKCNMRLYAPDILSQHCWICKVYDNENEAEYKCISLAPFPGAQVRVNDMEISQKTNIQAGDIVTLGQHYIFIFKDPTNHKGESRDCKSLTRDALAPTSDEKSSLFEEDAQWHAITSAMSISFSPDKQEEVLSRIFSTMSPQDEGYKVTPAYLLALAIDHSRQAMKREDLTEFLTKLCSDFQGVILEVTKSLQVHTQEMDSSSPVKCLEKVNKQLHSILFWMANCIELRGFLSTNQASYTAAVGNADVLDDAMNILSDAVIFAFQQAVYHLTKVLYPTLDLILTDNPFSRLPNDNPTMNDTLQSMSMILGVCDDMMLNKSIIQQLFSYLYFFIGTSLCNKMFEEGNRSLRKESASLFYNWEEGVKIRKNIELLENWSHDHQLEAANNYLNKVVSIADFLATSKQFLLQASWGQLRNLYPLLGAAQLRHLLENYDIGNRQVPAQWCPPSDEVYRIMEEGVMESFDDHPPLVIPSHSCVDLSVPLEDKIFLQHLENLNTVFGHHQSEDETDSGFDLGHSRSPTEVDDNTKSFGEHVKCGSRSSNTSVETGGKSYTPIFKKKRQTPPSRRSTDKSKRGGEYIMGGKYNENSDDNEGDVSSHMERVSLQSRHSNDTYTASNV